MFEFIFHCTKLYENKNNFATVLGYALQQLNIAVLKTGFQLNRLRTFTFFLQLNAHENKCGSFEPAKRHSFQHVFLS